MADSTTSNTIFDLMNALTAPQNSDAVVAALTADTPPDLPSNQLESPPADVAIIQTTIAPPDAGTRKPRLNRRTSAQVKEDAAKIAATLPPAAEVIESIAAPEVALFPTAETPPPAPSKPAPSDAFVEGKIGTLYIDCIPVGTPVYAFSKVLAAAKKVFKDDYMLEKESEFGKGAGRLRNAVRQALAGQELVNLYVDSSSPESTACLELLSSYARAIVRGVR